MELGDQKEKLSYPTPHHSQTLTGRIINHGPQQEETHLVNPYYFTRPAGERLLGPATQPMKKIIPTLNSI